MNKIFDKDRIKSIENGGCIGCDIEYNHRDFMMGVGSCTRGALNVYPEETAKIT